MANAPTDTSLGSLAGMGAGAAVAGPLGAMIGSSAGGLLGSLFGGGVDQDALDALKAAQQAIQAIPTPTAQDMQLILQPLVQQGILTPEAYSTILQQPTEFTQINLDQTPRNAEIAALNQMQDIANQGGNDAEFRAAMNNAENQANTQQQGQSGAILQNAAERGALNSNMTTAAQLAAAFSGNQTLANSGISAAADAENRALQAISESATLGGNITAQDYNQAAQKAAAQDAINRYNAQTSQTQSNMNVQQTNEAQAQNLDLAQQIAQYNNQLKNQQAQYNAQLPEQVFQNQLAKAGAMEGIAEPIANLDQMGFTNTANTQGNLIGGLGNTLSNYYNNQNLSNILQSLSNGNGSSNTTGGSGNSTSNSSLMSSGAYGYAYPPPQSTGQYQPLASTASATGAWARGGVVPGRAVMPGDHPANDTVPARLSPGEIVVPRSASKDPVSLAKFVASLPKAGTPKIHPDDVKTVLSALTQMRQGMYQGGYC